MSAAGHKSTSIVGKAILAPTAIALAIAMLPMQTHAWQSKHDPAAQSATSQADSGTGARVSLDRVVAIVNGDLVLQSDVEAEQHFAAFQPGDPTTVSQDQLIERLIDRTIILQQMTLQPEPLVSDPEVDAELASLRKTIPKCPAYHCETDAGWEKFVAEQGFDMQELRDRWRQRMQVLRFIEERFRMGITISPSDIDDYYQKTMIPAYQKEGVAPPPETTVADRIQEIVLQQRVNGLMDDWLTSLRAQGSVRILKPGEEAP